MHSSRRALLDRILTSPQFARTLTLGNILSYLCEKTADRGESIKEYEIATEVLRRDQSFDPKLDPVVRVSMTGIRERLQKYFEEAGKGETLRLVIPKGQYRAEFSEVLAPLAELRDDRDSLEYFWRPHFAMNQPSVLLHTEPLFFREGWGTYVRNLYVNNPQGGRDQLLQRLPELKQRNLHPSFHYLDAGEVDSMFLLMNFFHQHGIQAGVRNARTASWQEIRNCNLVLVGCSRTSQFVDMLQEETDFLIAEDEIRNLSPHSSELEAYRGERYKDGKLSRYREYALVTRRPGASQSSTITMIAANHGGAIEGAASYLTTAREIKNLLSVVGADQQVPVAKRFQILLKIEMIDLDDEIVNVEYVSHRWSDQ